jgi:hypothetical protein
MTSYTLKIVYESGQNPITDKWVESETEMLTVEAENLEKARRLAPVYSQIRGLGRWMRIYHNDTELLGNY